MERKLAAHALDRDQQTLHPGREFLMCHEAIYRDSPLGRLPARHERSLVGFPGWVEVLLTWLVPCSVNGTLNVSLFYQIRFTRFRHQYHFEGEPKTGVKMLG